MVIGLSGRRVRAGPTIANLLSNLLTFAKLRLQRIELVFDSLELPF